MGQNLAAAVQETLPAHLRSGLGRSVREQILSLADLVSKPRSKNAPFCQPQTLCVCPELVLRRKSVRRGEEGGQFRLSHTNSFNKVTTGYCDITLLED